MLQLRHQLKDHRRILGMIIFAGGFLFLVNWFYITDILEKHFSQAGAIYLVYSFFRVIFLCYFSWIIYYTGSIFIRFSEQMKFCGKFGSLDRFLISFFVGSAFLRILMFILGWLNLYYRFTALIITVPILVISFPDFLVFLASMKYKIKLQIELYNYRSPVKNFLTILFYLIIFFIILTLLNNKALLPVTNGDALTHYLPYYQQVIQNHGIWPNDLWYHFYLSKGSGLIFLAMLLTDFQATSLVSFCYLLISALTLFSLIQKSCTDRLWPLMAVIVYLSAFIYTPEWGSFEKQHIIMLGLISSIFWMIVFYNYVEPTAKKKCILILSLLIGSAIIFQPTFFPIMVIFLSIMTFLFLIQGKSEQVKHFCFLILVGSLLLIFILFINYFVTGVFDVTPVKFFWQFADQTKFSKWYSPYLVEYLIEGSGKGMADFSMAHFNLKWFASLFRIDKVRFLFVHPIFSFLLVLSAAFGLAFTSRVKHYVSYLFVPAMVMICSAGLVSLSVNQPVSIFRSFAVIIFFVIIALITLWRMFFDNILTRLITVRKDMVSSLIAGAIVFLTIFDVYNFETLNTAYAGIKLNTGIESYKDFYSEKRIYYDNLEKIREFVGENARVLTYYWFPFVPYRNFETEVSFAFKGDWHQMVFEEPQKAMEAFKRNGLNYFVIDLNKNLYGTYPYSILFEPPNILKFFKIVWSNKDIFLLTWREDGEQGVSFRFLNEWKNKIERGQYEKLYNRMRYIYLNQKERSYPIYKDPNLKPVQGWQ